MQIFSSATEPPGVCKTWLSKTEAVKQAQESISRYYEQTFSGCSVRYVAHLFLASQS